MKVGFDISAIIVARKASSFEMMSSVAMRLWTLYSGSSSDKVSCPEKSGGNTPGCVIAVNIQAAGTLGKLFDVLSLKRQIDLPFGEIK